MRVWNSVPLFRLLLPFVAGILMAIFLPLNINIIISLLSIFILIALVFAFVKKLYKKWRLRWVSGFAFNSIFLLIGMVSIYVHSDKNIFQHFSYISNEGKFIAVLQDQLHEKKNSYKTVVNVTAVKDSYHGWKAVKGQVLVYFESDTNAAKLKYGDVIIMSASPKLVELPKNPEEFNYKRFLSFHNIYHQVYLKSGQWKYLNYNDGNKFRKFSFDLRDRLIQIFKEKIIRKQEVGVASALVLGYEDNIDAELINAYSSAGALHVLSVSGMHVGIIFFVFNSMLLWMDKNKWLRHLKFILLLAFIWFYAMLTGFSPAVLRAAMMITVIIVGNWIYGNTNVFNTLIVSVFILLLYNPYLITEVGFQLSYLAVFGIVYLQPMIVKWFEPSNWLLYQIWLITSVSIAAQFMTFPLGLLYFHQFPNLFFISNLVVIPLSTIIIYISILLLFTASIPVFSTYLSVACFGLLYILNNSVLLVEKVPYSIMQGISITIFETWVIYLLMAASLLFILYKRPVYLQISLLLALIFITGQVIESILINKQKKIIIYDISREPAFDFIDGRKNYFIASNDLVKDKSKMMFHVLHNWWMLGMENTSHISTEITNYKVENLLVKNQFIMFHNKKLMVLKNKLTEIKKYSNHNSAEKLKLDFLILSGNNYQNVKSLMTYLDFKLLIIDSSYSTWRVDKIISECKELNVNVYSVPHQGAYIYDM